MPLRTCTVVVVVVVVSVLTLWKPSTSGWFPHNTQHPLQPPPGIRIQGSNAKVYPRHNTSAALPNMADEDAYDWKAHVRFMVLGIQKGGTTSLYKYMRQHPQIQVPAQKETRCFQVDYTPTDPYCARYFANPQFRQRHAAYYTGDFSPGYLWKTETAIPRVQRTYPDARFIVSLRHPIQRLISQYRMHTRNRAFPKNVPFRFDNITLESVCIDELEILRQEGLLAFWDFDNDDRLDDESLSLSDLMEIYAQATVNRTQFSTFFGSPAMVEAWQHVLERKTKSRGMVQKGLYAIELQQWLEAFPNRQQFLVISLEETAQHTERVMQRIHEHVGIPHVPIHDTAPVNTATDTLTDVISDQMRGILTKLYQPFDDMIAVVLGDERDGGDIDNRWTTPWKYTQPP